MRVLLTGATGFLGNNLIRELGRRDFETIAVVRHDRLPESLRGIQFEEARLDLGRVDDSTPDTLPPFDVCIHSAALIHIGWKRVAEARRINVDSTRWLARACLVRSARMVLVSTVNTLACSATPHEIRTEKDREPACPPFCYPVTKREAEICLDQIAANQGLDHVVVHPSFMLGEYDWRPSSAEMMVAVANRKPPFAPGGGSNVADVRDVANGILAAAQYGRRGENYILGGENLTYFELWSRMARAAGVRPPKFRLSSLAASLAGKAGDLYGMIRGKEPGFNSAATQMGQLFHYYSSDKAVSELGYQHRPVDESLELTVRWCRERKWIA